MKPEDSALSTPRDVFESSSLAPERVLRALLLIATDIAAIGVATVLAFASWAAPARHQPIGLYLRLWPLAGLFILAYWRNGLYPGFGLGGVEILRRLSISTGFVFLVILGLDFIFKLPQVYSRMTAVFVLSYALVLVPAARFGLLAVARRWRRWGEPCVVLGTGIVAEHTIGSLHRALTLGFRPVAVLRHGAETSQAEIEGTPIVGAAEEAAEFSRRGVRVAILVDSPEEQWSADDLARLQTLFQTVMWVHKGGELPVEGLQLKNLGGVVGVQYMNQLLRPRNRIVKRCMDLTFGSLLAVLSLPVTLLCMLAIRLSSRGPVFYAQEREGRAGRPIRVWKLRTMFVDAEERLAAALSRDPELRREWESRFKLSPDPRVIPGVGRFLRRFSLDELPQLWQVVAGQLSLVGPRPFPAYHTGHYDPSILELRRRVRPGVTGLWQVKVRGEGGLDLQQSHDAYYIRNWSLWLDLYVLGRTAIAVIMGRGAF